MASPNLTNLMLDPGFSSELIGCVDAWRRIVRLATENGLPVPAFSASLSYYDGYRRERGPAYLIQAQRDLFGAHTFKRTDREGDYHEQWG